MRRARTAAVVAGAVLATGITARAVAAPPAPSNQTLRFTTTVTQASGLNAQGVPGGLGRRGTLHAALHTRADSQGPAVGAVELELQVTSTTYPSTILQLGTIQLPVGTIAVQGVQAENQSVDQLAVVGGTGRYTDAGGTVRIDSDGTVVVHLTNR